MPVPLFWPLIVPAAPVVPVVPNTVSGSGANSGSTNDTPEDIIRKHLSPGLAQWEPGWSALIEALSMGDQTNFDNAALVFAQMFKSTASGVYLDRRCSDSGIIRPPDVGINDEAFRKLAIKTTNKKVVIQSLLETLEAYYGVASTRAWMAATVAGPYAIQTGWTLIVSIDGGSAITIPFITADFETPSAGTATEVSAVITRWLRKNKNNSYCIPVIDSVSGALLPTIYSSSLGMKSSVQVLGGQAQTAFYFPTSQANSGAGDSWTITKPFPGVARYTVTAAPVMDLSGVRVGDYANIYGTMFSSGNRGTFVVQKVDVRFGVQFFEVSNTSAVAEAGKVIVSNNDIIFFTPTKSTINDNGSRAVIVSQTQPGVVDVQLPATTSVVGRTIKTGAYGVTPAILGVSSATRNPAGVLSITTTSNHNLVVGNQVLIDGFSQSGVAPTTVAGNGASTTDASLATIWSAVADMPGVAAWQCEGVRLNDGKGFVVGGKTAAGASLATTQVFAITGSSVLAGGETRYNYTWTAKAVVPTACYGHRLTVITAPIQAGNVLLTGGDSGAGSISKAYLYNVAANTWSADLGMVAARQGHCQASLADGRVLVIGGRAGGVVLSSAEIFTPSETGGSFVATGSMLIARHGATATTLASGKVLVIGGFTDDTSTVATEKCEIYDPATGLFTEASSMSYKRGGFTSSLLAGDKVLVVGGTGVSVSSIAAISSLRNSEVYYGHTSRFYPSNNYGTAGDYTGHRLVLSSASRGILLSGSTSVKKLDVASLSWSPVRTSTLDDARTGETAITVGTGLVLVVGGSVDSGATVLKTAKLLVQGSDTISSGDLSGVFRVASIPSGTNFTVQTTQLSYTAPLTGIATVTPFKAQSATNIPGPYIWSPDSGVSITGINTTLTSAILAGTRQKTLFVSSTASFPDTEGYVVLGFGTASQLGPVKYLGVSGSGELIFDYSQTFPMTLAAGTSVILLDGKGAFVPDQPANVGSFYLTDSNAGRISASNDIDRLAAAGIEVNKTVVYPGDRGLGNEGYPASGSSKLSDKVVIWSSNSIDTEVKAAREDV
jgi:hypothetical protein